MEKLKNRKFSQMDSFYESKVIVFLKDEFLKNEIKKILKNIGFFYIHFCYNDEDFKKIVYLKKFDLILIDIRKNGIDDLNEINKIRTSNTDVEIITFSENEIEHKKQLETKIFKNFCFPIQKETIIKAIKQCLGNKTNYQIGMQFFDALFGMQMCTHRELHQKTFDHVIRTTKIYAKFLLYLAKNNVIELTSWTYKNCLMASLVHDIGKLLVMHGILYKDGKLSRFEFQQVKKHPWHSITVLLGGQDIEFFYNDSVPIETVSGYNEKNLSELVQKWLFKGLPDEQSTYADIENYFNDLNRKPFVHSLNRNLLYIVFRHHDGICDPYSTENELQMFSKIMGYEIQKSLSENSIIDIVTNSLSLCDMYDALMDTKRDYRKFHYNKAFTLYLLFSEMKNGKFFPFLVKHFIDFVVLNEELEENNPFKDIKNPGNVYNTISNTFDLFRVTRDQEYLLNQFMSLKKDRIKNYVNDPNDEDLSSLNDEWTEYAQEESLKMMNEFIDELKNAGLLKKEIKDFSLDEIKIFDMVFQFYFSYASPIKQKKLIEFLVETVINQSLSPIVKEKLKRILDDPNINNIKDLENFFIKSGYDRHDFFDVFRIYDEDLLVNEFNEFLHREGI